MPSRRTFVRWLPVGLLLTVAVAGAATWLYLRYVPRPSADQVRAVIDREAPDACDRELRVRNVHDLGGPGLPDGMVRFYGIECDVPGRPDDDDPRVAVVYKFTSADAGRRWIEGFDPQTDASYAWWLNGSTLLANINLSGDAWRRVTSVLGRDHDGRRVGHRGP